MLPFLLAAWIGGASVDMASTHVALGRGAHELYLPSNPWAVDVMVGGATAYGIVGTRALWKSGKRWQAVLVTGIAVGVHTAAAVHNMRVRQR